MRKLLWTFGSTDRGTRRGPWAWSGRRSPAVDDGPGAGGDRPRGPAESLCNCTRLPRGEGRLRRGGHHAAAADAHRGPSSERAAQARLWLRPVSPCGQGGLGVGGVYGRGVVYEQGQHVGYSDLTQGSVGVQAGGQSFSELLVFEMKAALDRFKAGQFSMAADASAVVLTSGVATTTTFVDGVAVVVQPMSGVMVEPPLGGSSSSIRPSEPCSDRSCSSPPEHHGDSPSTYNAWYWARMVCSCSWNRWASSCKVCPF